MAFWNKKEKEPQRKPVKRKSTRSFYNAWMAAVTDNLTESWTRSSTPINEQIKNDLETLRARSRDLAKNDPHVRKFIRLMKANIVGRSGVMLQSKVKNPNGTIDTVASNAIELAWKEFGKWGIASRTNDKTFVDLQGLFWDHILRDGEVLILKVANDTVNRFGYGLQFIDPEQLSVKCNLTLKSGNKVRMGVELDDFNAPIAYHLTSTNTAHSAFYQFEGKGYIRISADKVIHRFFSEYADQVRGVPEVASVLNRLKNLDGYEEAEIVSKRVSASKMGFFSRNAEGQGYDGADYDDGTESEAVSMDARPGIIDELPHDVNFSVFDPSHDGASYDAFVKSALKSISAGLGVSYHSLANDLEGVNYSSGRLGALEDRDNYMFLQDWFINCFIEPVFREWVESAVLRGQINIPSGGTLRLGDIDRYKDANFQARRWLWVDPQKDMTANEKAVALGLTSRAAIIREQGRDPEDVFREIAEENKRLEELGISQQPAQAGFLLPDEQEETEDE